MKGLISVVLVSILTACASAPPPAPFDWQKEFAGYWHKVNKSVRPVMVFRYPYMWEFIGDDPDEFGLYVSELKYIGTDGDKILFAERELSAGSFDARRDEYKANRPDEEPQGISFQKLSTEQGIVGQKLIYLDCYDRNIKADHFFSLSYTQQIKLYKNSNCRPEDYTTEHHIRPDRRIEVEVEAPFSQIIAPDLLPPDN